MFIELHRLSGTVITVNLNVIEYFIPVDNGKNTSISLPNYNGWLTVTESYDQVKETIANATRN